MKTSRVGVVFRKMASMEKQKPAHRAQPFRVCAGFHVPHARDACARQSPALSLACVTCSCRLTRPVRRATGLDSIRFLKTLRLSRTPPDALDKPVCCRREINITFLRSSKNMDICSLERKKKRGHQDTSLDKYLSSHRGFPPLVLALTIHNKHFCPRRCPECT